MTFKKSKDILSNSPYRKSIKLIDCRLISCYIYYLKPSGIEKKHYHDGIEIEYIMKGNCSTHKQGNIYIRKKSEIHESINNSKEELVFICITIPSESEYNTHYIK